MSPPVSHLSSAPTPTSRSALSTLFTTLSVSGWECMGITLRPDSDRHASDNVRASVCDREQLTACVSLSQCV